MASKSKQEWQENTLDPAKNRFGERQERFETGSGLEVDTVYTADDQDGSAEEYPGEFPYT